MEQTFVWLNDMEYEKIVLTGLDYDEALRYMGHKGAIPDSLMELMRRSEKKVLREAAPRYIYRVVDISEQEQGVAVLGSNIVLLGNDIRQHLSGCGRAIILCATLSAGIDRLIRLSQKEDIALALAVDALASAAIEQVCEKIGRKLENEFADCFITWRYGVGYGDFPIGQQPDILTLLDAPKKIGVNVTASNMLTPGKSVTVVMGISDKKIEQQKKSCSHCVLQGKCRFREEGAYCYDRQIT